MSMTNSQTRSDHDGPETHAGVRDKAHGAAGRLSRVTWYSAAPMIKRLIATTLVACGSSAVSTSPPPPGPATSPAPADHQIHVTESPQAGGLRLLVSGTSVPLETLGVPAWPHGVWMDVVASWASCEPTSSTLKWHRRERDPCAGGATGAGDEDWGPVTFESSRIASRVVTSRQSLLVSAATLDGRR